ncbi:hypothetical protein OIE66_04190 [Nonomuraea sp. NBC_01738]|uniref:hypothetical protein n=1 Tax=Nonomuraea sp. NBC_01738 TaxID=2976003 RepID=UPI002E15964E|nr:hypothetical protein OIE66_04190 [Nonomuraea sp. NBC_01738]
MRARTVIRWRDPRAPLTAAAAIGVAGFAAALVAGGPALLTGAIAGLTTALLAAVSLLVTSSKWGEHRHAAVGARWLGGGAVVWSAGVGLRPVATTSAFVVSFADLLVLIGTVLMAGGALIAAKRRSTGQAALRHLVDAYLCTASLFVIGWVVALREVYADAGGSPAFTLTLLPPMLCLLVTCAAIPVVLKGAASGLPLGLAGIGVLATTTVAEMASAVARLGDGTRPPGASCSPRSPSCCWPPCRGAGSAPGSTSARPPPWATSPRSSRWRWSWWPRSS